MKSIILLAGMLALPLSGAALAKEAKRFLPYPIKVDHLENGLTVARVPVKSKGLVAYYSAVRVGSRNEVEPDHTGFAHFFEHVMFKGTPKMPEGTRDRLLASLGFDDNAFTSDDMTVYHSFGPSSALKTLVEVEADRFKHLDFSEETFQTEAKAVLGEYNKDASHPELKIAESLLGTAFHRHTYRHTTLGFEADIRKMPGYYAYSKEFFKRWYTPDNTLLFVVGDFDDAQLMEWVRAQYSDWSGHAANVAIHPEPKQYETRSATVEWHGPTLPRQVFAWHTPASTLQTLDGAVQEVLAPYLVGPTSPLYKQLVLEKQLCESVGSDFSVHRDPYLFTLDATLKNERFRPDVIHAFEHAVVELVGGQVDAQRVEDVKSNLRYGLMMGLETPDQIAEKLAVEAAVFGVPDALERHQALLAKVKAQDLVQFVRRYFTIANRTSVVLQPKAAPTESAPEGVR